MIINCQQTYMKILDILVFNTTSKKIGKFTLSKINKMNELEYSVVVSTFVFVYILRVFSGVNDHIYSSYKTTPNPFLITFQWDVCSFLLSTNNNIS